MMHGPPCILHGPLRRTHLLPDDASNREFDRDGRSYGHDARNERGPRPRGSSGAGLWWMDPAMTDFRAWGMIKGLAGLRAVFGMGTGRAPPVWSPGNRPRDVSAARPRGHIRASARWAGSGVSRPRPTTQRLAAVIDRG